MLTNINNVSVAIKEAISQSQQIAQHYPNSQVIKDTCLACAQLTMKFKTALTGIFFVIRYFFL
jgi:hypothetical protein